MSFMWNVTMLIVALVVVRISHWFYRLSNPKCIGKLPPGSMGFPIIGETIDYFKLRGFNEIPPFLEKMILRYGSLFRTNIFMSKTVVSTDPDVNFQVFQKENTSFQIGYPDIFVKMFGKENLFFKQGETHKYIKKVTMQLLVYDALKQTVIGIMDKALHNHLRSLASQGNFDVKKEVDTYVLAFLTPQLISNLKLETETKLIDDLKAFNLDWLRSFFSLTNLKGLHKLLQRRRDVIKVIKDVLTRRKEFREKQEDFLNMMVEEMEKEDSIINQGSVINLIFLLVCLLQECHVVYHYIPNIY